MIVSKTATGQYVFSIQFYGRWMISKVSSVSFLCTHCFVWSRGALTVGCGPKTGGVSGDIEGCKISLSAMQMPICQKRSHFRIPYLFSPLQMPPLLSAARGGCPLPIKLKFEDKAEQRQPLALCGWATITQTKSNMADGRHLENCYYVTTLPRMIRFRWNSVCRWNHMPMTVKRSKSKPK